MAKRDEPFYIAKFRIMTSREAKVAKALSAQRVEGDKALEIARVDRTLLRMLRRRPGRNRLSRAAGENAGTRSQIEERERRRWSSKLADILEALDMPCVASAKLTNDYRGTLERRSGRGRPSTIRKRVRSWRGSLASGLGVEAYLGCPLCHS